MEFKPFPKIENIKKLNMQITQKIHGTNAQIFILEYPDNIEDAPSWMLKTIATETVEVDGKYYFIRAGSRNRWITPGDDNYGFAKFVYENAKDIVRLLGVGQHFGEWAGPGINSGEGLKDKTFVLFDHWKYPPGRPLPPQTAVVPVLYDGPVSVEAIDAAMRDLKENGSKLAPGFMRPEGIVVSLNGARYKKVFEAEETAWKKPDSDYREKKSNQKNLELEAYRHLLQPIRMEKLLSKDESLIRNYPSSLPQICSEYINDLLREGEIQGNEDQVKLVKKALGGEIFNFAKECVKNQMEIQKERS